MKVREVIEVEAGDAWEDIEARISARAAGGRVVSLDAQEIVHLVESGSKPWEYVTGWAIQSNLGRGGASFALDHAPDLAAIHVAIAFAATVPSGLRFEWYMTLIAVRPEEFAHNGPARIREETLDPIIAFLPIEQRRLLSLEVNAAALDVLRGYRETLDQVAELFTGLANRIAEPVAVAAE